MFLGALSDVFDLSAPLSACTTIYKTRPPGAHVGHVLWAADSEVCRCTGSALWRKMLEGLSENLFEGGHGGGGARRVVLRRLGMRGLDVRCTKQRSPACCALTPCGRTRTCARSPRATPCPCTPPVWANACSGALPSPLPPILESLHPPRPPRPPPTRPVTSRPFRFRGAAVTPDLDRSTAGPSKQRSIEAREYLTASGLMGGFRGSATSAR